MNATYVKLFTDTNIIVHGLQHLLDKENIKYIIKDRFESARLGGFGESMGAVELHVLNDDLETAEKILSTYKEKINS
ncbi:hypothetical protein BW723_09295 [Polaribacter reichenbachii]|uniref:DUF2007 domain-containing protein n=1 Tax=Polaribacter reichenbachii TaxID=996801 RepID=A0A1B8U795_9FLAO|nr:DUF2007 domain-containing protein [Polaribacter reichenbachii]APZ46478.1 hypothetical protein BW723_09295 [Polaribacter reichenbachii]AUC20343.1 hypothetical protein BTO17_17330 [Polaribacter reichenbachii]OBY67755.1 hypothetical protein LPB301_00205 [Polaribacter reichenbachii]